MSIISKDSTFQKEEDQSFSSKGYLDERIFELVQKMNSEVAIFNCTLVSYKNAYLLEKGRVPKMDVLFTGMPRPRMTIIKIIRKWPELFAGLDSHRSYRVFRGIF